MPRGETRPSGHRAPARHRSSERLSRASLTSPLRPAVPEFSSGKSLNGKERRGPKRRKSAVVPTKSILSAANVPIIGGHHGSCAAKFAGRMESNTATGALSRTRGSPGARGAAARAVPGRDQRHAGIGVAAVDRGFGGRRLATSRRYAVSAGFGAPPSAEPRYAATTPRSATNCHPCASSALNDRDPAREILHLLCLPWFGIALGFMG